MVARPSIRPACGLVLRRSAQDDRVYLVHRAPTLRAFGGLWAFPGGTLSASDGAHAASVRGAPPDLAAFMFAVAREALEETGLCLAELSPPLEAVQSDDLRRRLIVDPEVFAAALCERAGWVNGALLRPLARMVTPAFTLLRFDTQFFQADLDDLPGGGRPRAGPRAPQEQPGEPSSESGALRPGQGEPQIWPGELVDGGWDTPQRWLARWRAGELLIAPPVLLLLQVLERHGWDDAAAEMTRMGDAFTRGRIHPIFYNPAVQLIPLRTPTIPPATHTNAFLVGSDPAYLLDPATPYDDEGARLQDVLQEACDRGRRLAAIVLTHHHPDHIGAVERVRARWRLPVWAHPVTRDLLAGSIAVDRALQDGDRLPLGRAPSGRAGWELETIFTPGHAAGHLCFFEREYGSLIAGDMISTLSSILVDPRDGDMVQYMESLERLAKLPARVVFPSHGPAAAAGAAAVVAQLAHRRAREAAILAAIRDGAGTIAEVVTRVYTDVPASMHGFAALSVQSVVSKLAREGAVAVDGEHLAPV
jgi:ribonuclease/clavin/mitogillin